MFRNLYTFIIIIFLFPVHAQVIQVTLIPGLTNPSFGSQCINSFSNSTVYNVSGTGLIDNIAITAPAGFQVRTAGGTFSNSLLLTPIAGTVSPTRIEVRFSPVSTGATGTVNINHTSTGATLVPFGVDGTGTDGGTCNSFFIGPGTIVKVNPAVGSTPTLFVNGDISNKDAVFTNNAGIIELTGNWYNTSSANSYVSTGTERFSGPAHQVIAGNWSGISGNQNQFYDLKIKKSSVTGEYISLLDNVHINPAGTLQFESTNGIIRTQGASATTPYTGNYDNTLYVQNPSVGAILNNSTGNGAQTRYIEGKLKRQVNTAGTYYFPVGVEKGGLDGMEAFSVTFNAVPVSTGLLGYIQPASNPSINTDLITYGDVLFSDIGSFVDPNNNFSQCTGGPDGRDDVASVTQAITHEWITEAAGGFNYNMTVYPGPNLDNLTYSVMGSPCNALYTKAQYLSRNGRIGGDAAVGPTVNYWVPGVQGLYQPPTMTTITGQSAFNSRYRLFGAQDDFTSLPIELIFLQATPVDNSLIRLDWSTASEYNNDGFFIERSINGTEFQTLGWVDGSGNSSTRNDYTFPDPEVFPGVIYYYRLRQVDYDGQFTYSNTVSARLLPVGEESVLVFPNPSNGNISILVTSPADNDYTIDVHDATGRLVYYGSLSVSANRSALLSIPSDTWAVGMYLIRSRTAQKELSAIKILKQ